MSCWAMAGTAIDPGTLAAFDLSVDAFIWIVSWRNKQLEIHKLDNL